MLRKEVNKLDIDINNFTSEMRRGNSKALEFAVNTYANLVYKVVYSVLNHSFELQDIEECVSDVFMEAWNHMESYDEEKGNFKNWLLAIARYKAIDYKRKYFKQHNVGYLNDYIPSQTNIEEIVISQETREQLLMAIEEMGDIDKQIFIKRYFLSESIENIAQSIGCNRANIDNRLSRGRKVLREKLCFLKGEVK